MQAIQRVTFVPGYLPPGPSCLPPGPSCLTPDPGVLQKAGLRALHCVLLLALALLAPYAAFAEQTGAGAAPASSAAQRGIGRVVISSGRVEADAAGGGTRVLQKGDWVYEGDVLRTDTGGRTQVTFNDGGRLAVRPDSKLAIEAYHDATMGRTDQVSFRLERGGFRTATGRIARRNHAAYRFATPQAVIGIRGTDWGAELVEQEGSDQPVLQVGVNDGSIVITNEGGSLELGGDAQFDFATVDSMMSPPAGQAEPPSGLGDLLGTDLPPASDDDSSGEGGSQQGQSGAATDGEGEGDSTGDGGAAGSAGAGDDTPVIEAGADTGDDGGTVFEYGNRCF